MTWCELILVLVGVLRVGFGARLLDLGFDGQRLVHRNDGDRERRTGIVRQEERAAAVLVAAERRSRRAKGFDRGRIFAPRLLARVPHVHRLQRLIALSVLDISSP
jgi:hypothetical protein